MTQTRTNISNASEHTLKDAGNDERKVFLREEMDWNSSFPSLEH